MVDIKDIINSEAGLGPSKRAHPRARGLFLRLSDMELGALERALAAEHPFANRRLRLVAWLRDLAVTHASEVLKVEVTRAGLRHQQGGVPNWKRWRLQRAVRAAARRRR